MFRITQKGNWNKTENWVKKLKKANFFEKLDGYAQIGVEALREATPIDSGTTAASWTYDVKVNRHGASITWSNTNTNKGENIAILLQYGHGTGTGGYVVGRDYINPAMQPVFDKIAEDIWKEVISL